MLTGGLTPVALRTACTPPTPVIPDGRVRRVPDLRGPRGVKWGFHAQAVLALNTELPLESCAGLLNVCNNSQRNYQKSKSTICFLKKCAGIIEAVKRN